MIGGSPAVLPAVSGAHPGLRLDPPSALLFAAGLLGLTAYLIRLSARGAIAGSAGLPRADRPRPPG